MTFINWLSAITQTPLNSDPKRTEILRSPYYRFKSLDEVQLAANLGVSIDVNDARVDDWLRLPGLSIHQARSLVRLTQSGVQFHCLEDIAAALGAPLHLLQPLAPILQFCYYDPESITTVPRLNPNLAPVEALIVIPGIDPVFAKAIVTTRAAGPYRDLTDFQVRLYVPGAVITELMHYLQF